MSQELFVSVNQLIEMSKAKGSTYDHVVIESSGISEPKSVRAVFQDAESYEMQLMDKVWYYVLYVWTRQGVSVSSFGLFSAVYAYKDVSSCISCCFVSVDIGVHIYFGVWVLA